MRFYFNIEKTINILVKWMSIQWIQYEQERHFNFTLIYWDGNDDVIFVNDTANTVYILNNTLGYYDYDNPVYENGN